MALKDNLTPLWGKNIRGLSTPSGEANDAFLDALQTPLTQAQKDLYQAKLDSFLDTSEGRWLEYWGSWLGLHRANGQGDDNYRQALKDHVLHGRSTITSLRKAIAKYLKTNIQNIFIYEPYRDMFIWNSSRWNTYKFYPSTYYRYAVIDIQLEASYDKVASEIINLFRPAGVYWVVTSLVNVLNENAPIIDMSVQTKGLPFITEYLDYVGFLNRQSEHITPNFSKNWEIDNPFIYNDSLLNGGRVYYMLSRAISAVAFLGRAKADTVPGSDWNYLTSYQQIDPMSSVDEGLLSDNDGHGVDFSFNSHYDSYNLLTGTEQWTNTRWSPNDVSDYEVKYESDGSAELHLYNTKTGENHGNAGIYFLNRNLTDILQNGKKYVFSVDVRGSNMNAFLGYESNPGSVEGDTSLHNLSNSWQRLKISFTANRNNWGALTIYGRQGESSKTFSYDIRNVKLAEYTGSANDYTWAPSKDEAQRSILLGMIDFYNYFHDDQALEGNSKKDVVINKVDHCPIKNLAIRAKGSLANASNISIQIYNFDLKTWVEIQTGQLTQSFQNYKLSFVSIKPYINDNGMMYVKIVPTDLTNTIMVDYFGFSYGSNQYGVIDCYMPAQTGYGAFTQFENGTLSDQPIIDSSQIGTAVIGGSKGMKTVVNQSGFSNGTVTLNSISPTMGNDQFSLSFNYDLGSLDNADIGIELWVANGSTPQWQYGNQTLSLSKQQNGQIGQYNGVLQNVKPNTVIILRNNSGVIISNVSIDQTTEAINGNGGNYLVNVNPQAVFTEPNGIFNLLLDDTRFFWTGVSSQDLTINLFKDMNEDYVDSMSDVTFSFSAKGDGAFTSMNQNGLHTIHIPLDPDFYQRISFHFDNLSGAKQIILHYAGQNLYVKQPKLENGNVSTPYCLGGSLTT